MQNEGDSESPVEKCIARVQCKKKCSQRLPAAASATKQRLRRCHRCEASSPPPACCHLAHLPHVVLAAAVQPFANCSCIVHRMSPFLPPSFFPSPRRLLQKDQIKGREIKRRAQQKLKNTRRVQFFSPLYGKAADLLQCVCLCVCEGEKPVEEGGGRGVRGAYFKKLKMQNFICAA